MNSIYISDQGELLLINAPDKSKYIPDYDSGQKYEAALASAIAKGVKFKDQEWLKKILYPTLKLLVHPNQQKFGLCFSDEDLWMPKGEIFDLPTGYKAEVIKGEVSSADGSESEEFELAILSKLEEPYLVAKLEIPAEAVSKLESVVAPSEEVKQGFTDKQRIDWLEKMMTPDDRFCEIYFAGLRDFKTGRASSFQIESNPDIIKYQQAPTLREAIDLAIKNEKVLE